MVITLATEPNRQTVFVDPDRPDVWREDPYFSDIKTRHERQPKNRGRLGLPAALRGLPDGPASHCAGA